MAEKYPCCPWPYRTVDDIFERLTVRAAPRTSRPSPPKWRRRRVSRRTAVVDERRLIRKAFDIVRYDQRRRGLKERFLDVLGGRAVAFEDLLQAARAVIQSHNDNRK